MVLLSAKQSGNGSDMFSGRDCVCFSGLGKAVGNSVFKPHGIKAPG